MVQFSVGQPRTQRPRHGGPAGRRTRRRWTRSRRCTGPVSQPGPEMGRAIRLGALLPARRRGRLHAPGAVARATAPPRGRRPAPAGRSVTAEGRHRRRERPAAGDPRRADGAAPRGHRRPPHARRRRRRPAPGAGPGGGRSAHHACPTSPRRCSTRLTWRHLAPDLILALPAGATPADAEDLVAPAGSAGRGPPRRARTTRSPRCWCTTCGSPSRRTDPRRPGGVHRPRGHPLRRAGQLLDVPGTAAGSTITYTGPLLSDDLVEVVRRGIARGEGGPAVIGHRRPPLHHRGGRDPGPGARTRPGGPIEVAAPAGRATTARAHAARGAAAGAHAVLGRACGCCGRHRRRRSWCGWSSCSCSGQEEGSADRLTARCAGGHVLIR